MGSEKSHNSPKAMGFIILGKMPREKKKNHDKGVFCVHQSAVASLDKFLKENKIYI